MTTNNRYTSWEDVPLSCSVNEAAAALGLHANTIRNLITGGELPAKKMGREWRIAKSDLRHYLEGKVNEPSD